MKKKALISSVLTIAICLSLIAGSTFALFTSESSVNIAVTSGKVDVTAVIDETTLATTSMGLAQTNGAFANGGSATFDENAKLHLTNMTPGDKATFTIKVTNNSNVDVQYRVKWAVDGELLPALVATANDAKLVNNTTDWAEWKTTDAKEQTINVAVELPVEVGNDFQDKDAAIAFTVEAVQGNGIVTEITTADEFKAVLELGGTAKLANDVTLEDGDVLVVEEDKVVVIDLNGKTLTGVSHKSVGPVVMNNGTLTITGGTISSTAPNGGSAIANNGDLTVIDATLNGASNADGSWPSYTLNNIGVMTVTNAKITSVHGGICSYGAGAVATLNNTDIDMTGIAGFTSHALYTYSKGQIIVNGGNIANNAADQNSTGGSVINGAVIVNSGNFTGRIENYYDTPVLYGGTYSVKPNAKFVAEYRAVTQDATTGRYVVDYEEGTSPATSNEALADAIAKGDTTILLEKGTYEFPAGMSTDGLTIIGQEGVVFEDTLSGTLSNTTIKNVHIKSGNAQRWAYSKGTLLFEDCTFEATSVYAIHYDGLNNANITYKNCELIGWVAIGGGAEHVTFDGCTIKGNGRYGLIRLYSPGTIKNCTFDVKDVNTTDVYQDGIHAVGCNIELSNNKNVNGDMIALYNISSAGTLTDENAKFVSASNGHAVDSNGNRYAWTAAGLQTMKNWMDSKSNSEFWGKTYNIVADIDATTVVWNTKHLSPDSTTSNGITFNGNGHTISNLTVNGQGLFTGATKGGNGTVVSTFKDITFDNLTVTGGSHHNGAVWGEAYGSLNLTNVNVINSKISGGCNVGGLVGRNSESHAVFTFTDCSVKNTVIEATKKADNCGASAFLGMALHIGTSTSAKVVFNGTNVAEGNTLTTAEGMQGGGIYATAEWGAASWDTPVVVTDFTNYDSNN